MKPAAHHQAGLGPLQVWMWKVLQRVETLTSFTQVCTLETEHWKQKTQQLQGGIIISNSFRLN